MHAQVFVLRVEDPDQQEAPPETFSTIVPTFTQHLAGARSVCLWVPSCNHMHVLWKLRAVCLHCGVKRFHLVPACATCMC